jgi:hypothetical protein
MKGYIGLDGKQYAWNEEPADPFAGVPQEELIDEETDLFIELDRYYLDGLLSGDDYARILAGKVV